MSKGRKRTKGPQKDAMPMLTEPSPEERLKYAAKHLIREAIECNPGMDKLAGKFAAAARQGTTKLMRGIGKK